MKRKGWFVSHICDHRDWYKVNKEYQREKGVWSSEDKKHLIDTILKNLDMPKFYFRETGEKKYEIIDGQQRIQTILEFRNDEFSLDGRISGGDLDSATYSTLSSDLTDRFDTYELDCIILEDCSDGEAREMFRKLQRGKPLKWQEKLNAFPGKIVPLMRHLGGHEFFSRVNFSLKRYRPYGLIAKFLVLEKKGIIDISPKSIRDFFRKNKDLDKSSKVGKKVKKVLDYLAKVFPKKTLELSNENWIINLYVSTSELLAKYAMSGREKEVANFYKKCWLEVERARKTGSGPSPVIRFVDANTSGTTSRKNINTRLEYMEEGFIADHTDLELLDSKRYFDKFEKAVIYRKSDGKCEECGQEVDLDDYQADHIKPWIKGGRTKIKNGQVLCKSCNVKKRDHFRSI